MKNAAGAYAQYESRVQLLEQTSTLSGFSNPLISPSRRTDLATAAPLAVVERSGRRSAESRWRCGPRLLGAMLGPVMRDVRRPVCGVRCSMSCGMAGMGRSMSCVSYPMLSPMRRRMLRRMRSNVWRPMCRPDRRRMSRPIPGSGRRSSGRERSPIAHSARGRGGLVEGRC